MNKRNRKKNHQSKPIMSERIAGPEEIMKNMENEKEPLENLLFRPLIYKSSRDTIQFDTIYVPFSIEGSLLFMLMVMDGIGDTSIYVECYETDGKTPLDSLRDGTYLIRKNLEMEKLTGIQYYFGKLDKAFNHYLYALQLFVSRGILPKEQAVGLVKELGVDVEDMAASFQSVQDDMEKCRRNEAMIKGIKEESSKVSDMVRNFMVMIMGNGQAKDAEKASGMEAGCVQDTEKDDTGVTS